MDVLVLNAAAQPLGIVPLSTISWEDAIKAVYTDEVEVVATYENWIVRSPSCAMQVPSIVMLRRMTKVGRGVKLIKENICLRDDYRCMYCGDKFDIKHLTRDHVVPRARGGKTRWENIVSACTDCNTQKADEMTMKPLVAPWKPTYYDLVKKRRNHEIRIPDPQWNFYLQWPEEKIKLVTKH